MQIRIGFELIFDIPAPVPILLLLHAHPEKVPVLQKTERLVVEPDVPVQHFTDWFGNHAARLMAPAGKLRMTYDNVAIDSGEPEPKIEPRLRRCIRPRESARGKAQPRGFRAYCFLQALAPIHRDRLHPRPLIL